MLENVQDELNRFAKYVIQQARTNLTKGKKNTFKTLYNSLDSEIKVSKNSFQLSFLMEDYGVFQDKGVSGVKKKYDTPYKYTTKMPPTKSLDKWIVKKGLNGIRDKQGRFISRKSLKFMIARSIYNNGIKPSLFFTKPFNKAFKNIDKDLVKAFKLDAEQLLKNSINN